MASQCTIKCSKCGTLKGTTRVRLDKLIKQYGGKKKLVAEYVCRSCKSGNTQKKGKIVKVKKTKKLLKSKIICSKCNHAFGTTKNRMEKLTAKFGSLDEVQSNYVCTKCRKEHNCDMRGRLRRVRNKRRKKLVSTGQIYRLPDSMRFQGDEYFSKSMPFIMRPKAIDKESFNDILNTRINHAVKEGIIFPVDKDWKPLPVKGQTKRQKGR